MMEGWTATVNNICIYIMKIAYLNLLWIVFSVLGLLVFGIVPSTIAMFAVVRKVIQNSDVKITRFFWRTYKSEFIKGNFIGYILLVTGLLIGADIVFLNYQSGLIQNLFFFVLIVLMFVYTIVLINFIPVYVHYDLKLFAYLKQALFIGILRFWVSSIMVLALLAVWIIMYFLPGLAIFFFGSFSAYVLMFVAYRNFAFLEEKALSSQEG